MLSALSEEPSCDSWLSLFKTGLKEANRLNLAPIAVARSRTESGNTIQKMPERLAPTFPQAQCDNQKNSINLQHGSTTRRTHQTATFRGLHQSVTFGW